MSTPVRKLLALLNTRERTQLYWLFAAMVGMALIDVASVGSIMPFMGVVTNPDFIFENQWLGWSYQVFGFTSKNHYLLALGCAVLTMLVLSNVSTALITWLIFHFSWMRNHTLSTRLFSKYLSEPYEFFLNQNTAELKKNVLDEVQLVIISILISLLLIVKNGVAIVCICGLLISVDVVLTIMVATMLGGAYVILFLFTSKLLHRIGVSRAEANKKRFRSISEALSGIKVLRVLGREHYFLNQFSHYSRTFSDNIARKSVIAQLPRYAFEVMAFGGVIIIIIYFLIAQKDLDKIVPLLSLYAFAGYRLLPAMQIIFNRAANIRYALPALDMLHAAQFHQEHAVEKHQKTAAEQTISLQHGISFKKVSYAYPAQQDLVLNELDLFLPAGKTIGFAGVTGSGKTTVIDLILGLLSPKSGAFSVDATNIDPTNVRQWQRQLGYVPQDIFLTDESIRNNIALGVEAAKIDEEAMRRAARLAQVDDFVSRDLVAGYDTLVGERGVRLSGGQKQRVGIARALYHNPEVLILDEATSALDNITEQSIMQAIRQLAHKKTIIMIAHRLTTLQDCDHIYMLAAGTVVAQGSYQELSQSCPYFQETERQNE